MTAWRNVLSVEGGSHRRTGPPPARTWLWQTGPPLRAGISRGIGKQDELAVRLAMVITLSAGARCPLFGGQPRLRVLTAAAGKPSIAAGKIARPRGPTPEYHRGGRAGMLAQRFMRIQLEEACRTCRAVEACEAPFSRYDSHEVYSNARWLTANCVSLKESNSKPAAASRGLARSTIRATTASLAFNSEALQPFITIRAQHSRTYAGT